MSADGLSLEFGGQQVSVIINIIIIIIIWSYVSWGISAFYHISSTFERKKTIFAQNICS